MNSYYDFLWIPQDIQTVYILYDGQLEYEGVLKRSRPNQFGNNLFIYFFIFVLLNFYSNCQVSAVNVWLVWFDGISTDVGYLMPNPVDIYISNIYYSWADFVDNIFKGDWDLFVYRWFQVFLYK